MARGWESKSVESQQSEDLSGEKRIISAEERERAIEREALELQLARVKRELDSAVTPAHRAAKQHAIEHLEQELAKLSS